MKQTLPADAQIVLINKIRLTREDILGAPRLELIAVAGTGTDGVDLGAAQERGVAVCNVRGYCTASVVQHAWALILSLTQHLAQYARLATDGSWVANEQYAMLAHPIRELSGRVLGIVGWGTLGRGVGRLCFQEEGRDARRIRGEAGRPFQHYFAPWAWSLRAVTMK